MWDDVGEMSDSSRGAHLFNEIVVQDPITLDFNYDDQPPVHPDQIIEVTLTDGSVVRGHVTGVVTELKYDEALGEEITVYTLTCITDELIQAEVQLGTDLHEFVYESLHMKHESAPRP
jgi:hypothetical protein